MTSVWELDLTPVEKLVLLALADCANDEGLAWPSIATIRRKANVGERTVQRSIRSMEKMGLLKREEVSGKGCRYIINPRHSGTPARKSPPPQSAQTPATVAPKPSRTVIGLSSDKPKRAKLVAELPDWLPLDRWQAYLDMRSAMRKKPTAEASRLLIAKLDRWRLAGHDPGAILDNSTENNWTGLFEPRKGTNDNAIRATGSQGGNRSNLAKAIDEGLDWLG
jgi:hypothetical protein